MADIGATLLSIGQNIVTAINGLTSTLNLGWLNIRYSQLTAGRTIINSDRGSTLGLAGGFLVINFASPASYSSNFIVTLVNEDSTRGKFVNFSSGGGSGFMLWPLQSCILFVDNGSFKTIGAPARWVLPGDTTFFVDSVNGNDGNDGLAATTGAFQSFAPINKLIGSLIDTNQKLLVIRLAAGQSWSNFALTVPIIGGGTVFLDGSGDTITTTTAAAAITVETNSGGGVFLNASFGIQNMIITGSGGGHGLSIVSGVGLIHSGVTFGTITGGGSHIQADGNSSRLLCDANYTISGGASSHIVAIGGALIDFNGAQTITVSGTPAFAFSFALATILAEIVSFVTWSGAATGTRYFVDKNSVIWTNGGGANYFPGNVPGVAATGGQYG